LKDAIGELKSMDLAGYNLMVVLVSVVFVSLKSDMCLSFRSKNEEEKEKLSKLSFHI
jgi:hypothetical protein